MDNLAKAKYNYGDHKINNERRFPPWESFFLLFVSQNHTI